MESFVGIREKVIRNSRNESHHSLFVTINKLDEAKVIFVNALFDTNPLMLLEPLLLDNLTSLHNLSHLIDRNHGHTSKIDSAKSLQYLLNVLRLVCLAVDDTLRQLTLKNFQNVKWISHVKELNELVCYFYN